MTIIVQAPNLISEKSRPVKGTKCNLTSVALQSLRIFVTCRQIYHEATTVFLSQNAFCITRPRCSPWNGGPEHDDGGKLFTEGADWILSLGSQLSKLRTITLDLNALCIMHQGNLELLPLLRALWARSWTGKLEFKSASAMALWERRCEQCGKVPGIGDNPDLATINGMIASLLRDDLNIQQHVWALGHIALNCRSLDGLALFHLNRKVACKPGKTHRYDSRYSTLRSDGSCLEHRLDFRYEDGKCVRIPRTRPRLIGLPPHVRTQLRFIGIPPHVRTQIFGHVLHFREPVSIDLSSGTGDELPNLLCTNRVIRTDGAKQYYRSNSFSLLVKYQSGQDDLVTLDKMVRWLFPPPRPDLHIDVMDIRRERVRSLVLDFESLDSGPRRLEDLRINTADLYHKRVRLGGQPIKIQVKVRLWSMFKKDGVFEEAAFSLDDLLKSVQRALHELYNANMGFRRNSMLEIVVDGHGNPMSYVHPATMKIYPFPQNLTAPYGERWLQWHKQMKKQREGH